MRRVADGSVTVLAPRGPRGGRWVLRFGPEAAVEDVYLVTAAVGMDGTLLRGLAASRPRGVVVAATGSGNTHPDLLAAATGADGCRDGGRAHHAGAQPGPWIRSTRSRAAAPRGNGPEPSFPTWTGRSRASRSRWRSPLDCRATRSQALLADPALVTAERVILGRVATLAGDSGFGWERGLAIADGRVVAVGDRDALARAIGPGTDVIELGDDQLAMPGITDAHLHLMTLVLAERQIDLTGLGPGCRPRTHRRTAPRDA